MSNPDDPNFVTEQLRKLERIRREAAERAAREAAERASRQR